MDEFCGSTFWDLDVTWRTGNPDFTACFQKTVLVWIPCGFYWLFGIIDLHPMYSCSRGQGLENTRRSKVSWNIFNITKVLIMMALMVTQIVRLSETLILEMDGYAMYGVDKYTPIIQLFTYLLTIIATIIAKREGIIAANMQFVFWGLTLIAGVLPFRTALDDLLRQKSFWDDFPTLTVILAVIDFPLIVAEFLLHCWADVNEETSYEDSPTKTNKKCPRSGASSLNRLLFSWFDGLTWKGYKKALELKDLWDLEYEMRSKNVVKLFDRHWTKRMHSLRADAKPGAKPLVGLLPVLFSAFGWTFVAGAFLKLVPDLLAFVSPQILNLLIGYVNDPTEENWKGYLYAVLLFLAAFLSTLGNAHYNYMMYSVSIRAKSALVSAVYRKALVISNQTKKESTVGEIVNLMTVDVQKVLEVIPYFNMIWSSPLQIGLSLYFLWGIMGPSVFAGVGVMLLLIPVNGMLGGYIRKYQIDQMKNKDDRVKIISEILSGIKILKLYGWEPSFQEKVLGIRNKEIKNLNDTAYLSAVNDFLWTCSQFMVTVATFATYVLVDDKNVLDAQTAFVALSLLNVMTVPLTALPMVIIWSIQAMVSLKRLNKFINSEEIDFKAITHDSVKGENHPIIAENASFSWDSPQGEPVLKNIQLKIPKSSLTAVVGTVGSGKSSLLSAFLGELYKTSGSLNISGSVSYVAQQAWIQNATLKENVLFGKNYDPMKYDKVIESCSLLPDLEILPGRDNVEIGENGINLSGGQKQRVSIARAVYHNSDLYFLDDPLSAVDSHVGKHIFDKVIGPKGLLKKKTRVLVTHSLTFLPQVDRIICMKNGQISEIGGYQELLDKKGDFADYIEEHGNQESEETEDSLAATTGKRPRFYLSEGDVSQTSQEKQVPEITEVISGLRRRKSSNKDASPELQKLIGEETSETESVSWRIYYDYFKAASWRRVLPGFFLYFCYQGFALGANFWLNIWTNEPVVNGTQENRDLYLGVYAGLGVGQSISFMGATVILCLSAIRSASVFHADMLGRILRAPMWFFDTTPTGRILNRFSKDVDVLDNLISFYIRNWLAMFTTVAGTIGIIMYTTPIFAAVVLPIGVFYYVIQRFYIPTSRQLKRLESVTRSPIYSHFGETISGAATIRAYGVQARFIEESEEKVDLNQACAYPAIVSTRWLAVRLETAGSFVIFFAALFAALSRDTLNPGLVGLSISYSLQITFCLGYLVRTACDIEANIVAAERIQEYGNCPQEAPWKSPYKSPPRTWPAYGSVSLQNYSTRYRPGLDLVLKDVTCNIEPGEKIGVVGRTGAGKSSLTLALFRIIEPAGGAITIDGEDLSRLGLHEIRTRITIIPQDPVLFSGTLRFNLDPFKTYSDMSLWRALELAHLRTFVQGLPEQLEHAISEGGGNLSVGQKQLVCLARALLRDSKILILDEATASIDLETDDLIQETIRKEFQDSTIITIAHRLNTVMDSSRIIVIDNGRIAEMDTPSALLCNKDSIFYSMAADAGLLNSGAEDNVQEDGVEESNN